MKNKKGFTLIELLVVIAIIGLLSTLAVVSLNNARSKARDARRTADLKTIQSAIELLKADNNDQIFAVPATWAAVGTTASPDGLVTYLPGGMPVDPTNVAPQVYTLCTYPTNDNYILYANLENPAPSSGSIGAISGWVVGDCLISTGGAATVAPVGQTCGTQTPFCLGDNSR